MHDLCSHPACSLPLIRETERLMRSNRERATWLAEAILAGETDSALGLESLAELVRLTEEASALLQRQSDVREVGPSLRRAYSKLKRASFFVLPSEWARAAASECRVNTEL